MSALFISKKECEMRSAVKKTLRAAGVKEKDRLIVAVSGGVDSIVLLHVLRGLAEEMAIELIVCHVDHRMRDESAHDAEYVAEMCHKWNITCRTECVDVWARVRTTGESPEEAARNLRYDVFYRLSEELGGAKIVLAHHRDDQAETVLLHLLRGTGTCGLGGIRRVRGRLLRPFLMFAKSELEAYAAEYGLVPCVDMTNYDTKYLRNRIRHQLLPELESYQPQVRRMLCRLAQLSQEEEDFMEAATDGYWERIMQVGDEGCAVDREAFRQTPLAIQRRLVRRAVQTVLDREGGLSFAHSERLRQMITDGRTGTVCPLSERGILRCAYDRAVFEVQERIKMQGIAERCLAIGEENAVEECHTTIRVEIKDTLDGTENVVFDADLAVLPLHIRSRRAGDVIATRGKAGKKKLKKELIDCKIAISERDMIPLVCDANDTILWVVGVRTANIAQVNAQTKQYLCLKSKKEIVLP